MIVEDKLKLQVKAKVVFIYLEMFNELEERVKQIFRSLIKEKEACDINKLHFYYGLKAYRVEINYDENSFDVKTNNYDKSCDFNTLTLTDINKFNNSEKIVEELIFDVQSLQTSRQYFSFFECVKKLVNMRNVLAHRVLPPRFQNRCYIELLSDERLSNFTELVDESEIALMDEQTKQILSNVAYIGEINEILDKKFS